MIAGYSQRTQRSTAPTQSPQARSRGSRGPNPQARRYAPTVPGVQRQLEPALDERGQALSRPQLLVQAELVGVDAPQRVDQFEFLFAAERSRLALPLSATDGCHRPVTADGVAPAPAGDRTPCVSECNPHVLRNEPESQLVTICGEKSLQAT